jgi:Glycine/D-amino acid oxidases (deaminating)
MTRNTFSPTIKFDAAELCAPSLPTGSSITVLGAGAFGGWTALYLLRSGYRVTLIDSWGSGNSRSSSGDETRVIRSTYGSNELYFDLNVRALALWKENQERWNKKLFFPTGVLWMCYENDAPLSMTLFPSPGNIGWNMNTSQKKKCFTATH